MNGSDMLTSGCSDDDVGAHGIGTENSLILLQRRGMFMHQSIWFVQGGSFQPSELYSSCRDLIQSVTTDALSPQ